MVLPSQTGINVFRPSLFLALVMGLVLGLSACGGGGDVAPTPDIEALIETAVDEALGIATPDFKATVEAWRRLEAPWVPRGQATLEAKPSPTIVPDAAVNFNKGVEYIDKGQYELAVAEFTKAIDLDSNYAKAYYNRGVAYGWLGESSKANQDFAKACELDPSFC